MSGKSLYQVGGNALLVGAFLFIVGMFQHPQALGDPAPSTSLWLFTFGWALTLAGVIALSRHFARGEGEGLGILALASALVGAIAFLSMSGPESAAFAAHAAGDPAAADAFYAGALTLAGLGGVTAWFAVAVLGLAMLKDSVWPRWIAFSGIVIGLVAIAADLALDPGSELRLILLLGFLWLGLAGWTFAGLPRRGAAAQAPVAGGPGD